MKCSNNEAPVLQDGSILKEGRLHDLLFPGMHEAQNRDAISLSICKKCFSPFKLFPAKTGHNADCNSRYLWRCEAHRAAAGRCGKW